ncbi:M-phase inducer phosphatase [Camponotus floridanus]|uniref:protein-tyrosine-phosphatase n=1 Tax=Camponotus floridanus TaxID=104421 RepID=E2ABH7_CAMFO|nr:M-phase inducer phosphatase isoform X2 [Camponotus floridanus]EFN69216.1 M-phase inducer phosphatase [Camponotus floridanus]
MDILHTIKHPATDALIRSAGNDDTNIRNIGALERLIDALTKTACRSDMTNADILDFCKKQLNEQRKHEYECENENKENDATISLYNPTPQKACKKIVRCPLEKRKLYKHSSGNHSESSIDDKDDKRYGFRIASDTSAARRMLCSPLQSPSVLPNSRTSLLRDLKTSEPNFLRSLSSGYESMDEGFVNELVDMETIDDETQLPSDLSKLLSGDIVAAETSMDCDVSTTPEWSRANRSSRKPSIKDWSIQREIYKREINTRSPPLPKSPSLSKIRTCLFRSPKATCSKRLMRTFSYDENSPTRFCVETSEISPHTIRSSYKRPPDELPEDELSTLKKTRRSSFHLHGTPRSAFASPTMRPKLGPKLQRSLSETETHTNIKWAVHRSVTDTDLIGDFSKPCILPITMGHHPDLKSITSDTLAALLRGEFADRIGSYKIIDCRYPYEYEGGHIAGALNLYDKGLIAQVLFDPLTSTVPKIQTDIEKRDILVFHCEFSWERGPNLSRLLRRMDREFNEERYPALFYPEIYLLQGGYEKFYGEQKEFCLPQDYKPMRHPNHDTEFRFFRNKSKSWQGDGKPKGPNPTTRTHLKRLGF